MANRYMETVQDGLTVISAELFNRAFDQIGEDVEKLESDGSVNGTTLKVLKEDVDFLKSNPFYHGKISSFDEFPKNPVKGTICEITETFTNEGIIYGGRACDLFEITDGTGFLNDDEVDGTLYVLYFKGEKPSNTLFFKTADTVEEMFIRAYSIYGVCVGDIHASMPVGFPALLPLRFLGATEDTDPVTFYVGINQYTNSDNQFDNIPSGEFINVYNAGELAVWTGTRWANIPPTVYTAAALTTADIMSREIVEMKSNIGNIGAALDELHAYAQALVNGGATS